MYKVKIFYSTKSLKDLQCQVNQYFENHTSHEIISMSFDHTSSSFWGGLTNASILVVAYKVKEK